MDSAANYITERDDFVTRGQRFLPWLTAQHLTYLAFWADTGSVSKSGSNRYSSVPGAESEPLQELGCLRAFKDEPPWIERRIPKRGTTEQRVLMVPNVPLKQLLRFLLRAYLSHLSPDRAAFGFEPGRSRREHAQAHCGKFLVVRLDIRRFFPSIGVDQLIPILDEAGFKSDMKRILAHLVTYHQRLAQGAPTSPKLADLVARPLDRRLRTLAKRERWAYSRYADDLCFSCSRRVRPSQIREFIGHAAARIEDEGFTVNQRKTRIMKRHNRQIVAGALVNNSSPTVPREKRRRLDAILHNCEKNGLLREARKYRRGLQRELGEIAVEDGRYPGEVKRSDRIWPYDRQDEFIPRRLRDPLVVYSREDWTQIYDFWHYVAGLVGEVTSLDPRLGRHFGARLRGLKITPGGTAARLTSQERETADFWDSVGGLVPRLNQLAPFALRVPQLFKAPAASPEAARRVVETEDELAAFAIDIYKYIYDTAAGKEKGYISGLWKAGKLLNLQFAVELRMDRAHDRDPEDSRQRRGAEVIAEGYRRLHGKGRPNSEQEWTAIQRRLAEGVLTDLEELRSHLKDVIDR